MLKCIVQMLGHLYVLSNFVQLFKGKQSNLKVHFVEIVDFWV